MKNNECLSVNILPQIAGNCLSELPNFKNFLGGGACSHIPLEDKGHSAPFISCGRANKRETTTSNLTESTALEQLHPIH